MSEQLRIDDLINRGTELQIKFVYGMISIALGTLALSFQFSIKFQAYPFLLIISWIILFISALLGTWRIYILPTVFFSNANFLSHELEIFKFQNMHVTEEIQQAIYKRKLKSKESSVLIDKISNRAIKIFNIQITLLIIGLFLLGLFTALNYLICN